MIVGERMVSDIRSFMFGACLLGMMSTVTRGSNIDVTNKHAWAENAGWANVATTNGGVTVHFNGVSGYLTGLAWGENIGWLKFGDSSGGPYANTSATDWGVNLDATGHLSGYAWGENVGWVKFDHALGGVQVDTSNGHFSGAAWGENIGWLKFKGAAPDYSVRTLAFDTQPQGTPNWWLAHYGVTELYDAGDGVPAWKKYVMDTDPTAAGSYLRITSVSNSLSGTDVTFWPASARRYYTLQRRDDLVSEGWSAVEGSVNVPGSGGLDGMRDTAVGLRRFYRVSVGVSP